MLNLEKAEDLIFCYSQQNPNSLVMLYRPERVLEKMTQQPKKVLLIWIIPQIEESLKNRLQEMQKNGDIQLLILCRREQIKKLLIQKNQSATASNEDIFIVYSPGQNIEINLFKSYKIITKFIEYSDIQVDSQCQDEESENQNQEIQNKEEESQNQENQDQKSEIVGETNSYLKAHRGSLIKLIKLVRNQRKYKNLTNFVVLNSQVWKSNALVKTMVSILNSQIDLTTRQQILEHFRQIRKDISKVEIQQFIDQLKQGALSLERAIHWYSSSVVIHKIMNNILRSSSHPSQIFYVQPFFKDLFRAIKSLSSLHQKQRKDFVCYRGGSLEEIEKTQLERNIGGIVKNLCFFSTSLSEGTAFSFKINAIFQILVYQTPNFSNLKEKTDYDYGYANIKQYSYFSHEEEILFNPLSSFKVLEVCQYVYEDSSINYLVKLEYGSLTKIMNKDPKELTENQKCLQTLGKIWKQEEIKITNQGQSLLDESQVLANGRQYWLKYYQISKSPQQKCTGLINWGMSQQLAGNYKESLRILSKAKSFIKQQYELIEIWQSSLQQKQIQKLKESLTEEDRAIIDLNEEIQIRLGNVLQSMGNHQQARQIFEKCCKLRLTFSDQSHPNYLRCLKNLAHTYQSLRKHQKALQLYTKCASIRRNLLSPFHPLFLVSLRNMASGYYFTGHYDEARKIYDDCLRLLQLVVGTEHLQYLTTMNVLASTFFAMKQHKKAQQLYEKNHQQTGKLFGEMHPYFFISLNNLTFFYLQSREHKKLKQLCQKIVQIGIQSEKVYQPTPQRVRFLNHLAFAHQLMGDLKKALQVQKKCCKLTLDLGRENHPDYVESMHNLASIFEKMGKYQNCLQIRKKCKKLVQEIYGKCHQHYFSSMNNLAATLCMMGKIQEAKRMLEQCCRLRLQFLGQNHPQYADSLNNLASIFLSLQNYNKALQIYEIAQKLAVSAYGEQDSRLLSIMNNIALIHYYLGKNQLAQELFINCAKLRLQVLGQNHPDYISTLNNLANTYFSLQKYTKAIEFYEKCRQFYESVGKANVVYLTILNNLAMTYLCVGQLTESQNLQNLCCKLTLPILGKNHPEYHRNLKNLGTIYQNLGDYYKSLRIYVNVEKLVENQTQQQYQLYCILNNIAFLYQSLSNCSHASRVSELAKNLQQQAHIKFFQPQKWVAATRKKIKRKYERKIKNIYSRNSYIDLMS